MYRRELEDKLRDHLRAMEKCAWILPDNREELWSGEDTEAA